MKFTYFATFFVCGALATACTVTTGTGTGGAGGSGSTTTSTKSATSSTKATGTGVTATTTTGSGGLCSAPTTSADCASCPDKASCVGTTAAGCCETANAAGVAKFNDLFVADCACATGSTCKTECGGATDICADPAAMPSAACDTCLKGIVNTDACIANVITACKADTGCKSLFDCIQACPP